MDNRKLGAEDRAALEKVAFMWPGHDGCDFSEASDRDVISLIADAVEYDRRTIEGLRANEEKLRSQLAAATDAYENMRDFAASKGLDVTARNTCLPANKGGES